MLRKHIIQSLNKRSFSSINKQNVFKTASLSMKSVQPRIISKSFYSSDNGDGARFDDKFMNVSVEDFVAYGLSIATVYYILDSIFGEKKPEEVDPIKEEVEETEEVEPIKEEVEESQPVMEEEKNAAETADVDEIAKKNDEEEAVNDTLALEEENAVEATKILEEENLANEQTAQEEAVEETTQKEAVAEESTEESASSTEEAAPATEEGAVDPSAGPAYNPETGEINWDCPCLGGMAHGPCGEEFKTAFSCFIYSEAEPKGVDCVEKFQGMQECFKKHPEIYAEQLRDDDEVEHAHPVEEQPTEITEVVAEAAAPAAEPETVVEEILVGDVPAAVIEEIVPIVEEKVEEITPIVEEKVEEIVAKTEDANIIPEAAEELIEEGLPVNADD